MHTIIKTIIATAPPTPPAIAKYGVLELSSPMLDSGSSTTI